MAEQQEGQFTGAQKAAALFLLLGPEVSAKVLKNLSEVQLEKISAAIVSMGTVPVELKKQVLEEFAKAVGGPGDGHGGMSFMKDVLEKSIGIEKAKQILQRVSGAARAKAPFAFIKKADPAQLLNFIQSEHPQTIALVLAHLEPSQSSVMLSSLSAQQQAEVAKRIAVMDKTTPEVIKEVEGVLEKKLSAVFQEDLTATGGVKIVAEVLNRADRATERAILEEMEKDNPELVNDIKKLMFVFEDIILIDDRGMQQILKQVDNKELAMALKTASEEVKEKIFKNMSKRAAEAIKEEMEFMGPVRVKQVEEAQQGIVAVVRRLEESGEIIIAGRGGEEDELVE